MAGFALDRQCVKLRFPKLGLPVLPLVLSCLTLAGCKGVTIARVSVVDAKTHRSIRGANVTFTAYNWNLDPSGKNHPPVSYHEANTGRDNAAWFAAWDNTACCDARIDHFDGYYRAYVSRQGIPFPLLHLPFFRILRLEAVPVRNPVSLIHHDFGWLHEPVANPPLSPDGSPDVAIDLMEGELLPPWGHGKIADILVSVVHSEKSGRQEPRLHFTFPGEGNGICSVEPNLKGGPYVWSAPETGYSPEFGPIGWEGRNYNKPLPCHCIRIRSRFDGEGNLVSCHYGKIYDCIRGQGIYHTPPLVLLPHFSCYLNPTPLDTNLEPLPPYPDRCGP